MLTNRKFTESVMECVSAKRNGSGGPSMTLKDAEGEVRAGWGPNYLYMVRNAFGFDPGKVADWEKAVGRSVRAKFGVNGHVDSLSRG